MVRMWSGCQTTMNRRMRWRNGLSLRSPPMWYNTGQCYDEKGDLMRQFRGRFWHRLYEDGLSSLQGSQMHCHEDVWGRHTGVYPSVNLIPRFYDRSETSFSKKFELFPVFFPSTCTSTLDCMCPRRRRRPREIIHFRRPNKEILNGCSYVYDRILEGSHNEGKVIPMSQLGILPVVVGLLGASLSSLSSIAQEMDFFDG